MAVPVGAVVGAEVVAAAVPVAAVAVAAVAAVVLAAVVVAAVAAVVPAAAVASVVPPKHPPGGPIIWRPDLRDLCRDLCRRAHVGDALSRLGSPAWGPRGAYSLAAAEVYTVYGAWRKLAS